MQHARLIGQDGHSPHQYGFQGLHLENNWIKHIKQFNHQTKSTNQMLYIKYYTKRQLHTPQLQNKLKKKLTSTH